MPMPESYRKDFEAMPASLRALLEAELRAGNEIAEVGHSFPAPPAGAYFRLTKPLLTRAQTSGDGIVYYDRNNSTYSGEITDAKRFHFLLEPPRPPEPEPDMEAIRAKHLPPRQMNSSTLVMDQPLVTENEQGLVRRFESSMIMDFDKWHDGIGYDLDALRAMAPAEKKLIEALLLRRGARDWRDIEALACLDTFETRRALQAAMNNPNPEVRNAVTRCVPELIPDSARTASLVKGLETANFYGGLSQTLDQVAEFHPPLIVETLLRGVLARGGDVAVHFAAMICYIHGQAPLPFDMEQQPFFLRFNTENHSEREAVFRELCQKTGVEADRYLIRRKSASTPPMGQPEPPDHTVEVDVRGEMLTYCELTRSAHVICTFSGGPRIVARTLSNWFYPLGRRSEKMSAEEKELILGRIADYCRKHHRMNNLTSET